MTKRLPVFPTHHSDFEADLEPCGHAATPDEANALLTAFYKGTGWDEPVNAVVDSVERKGKWVEGWFDEPAT